jgi:prepilin-type N-terminal cleavage/methylation domain-containing protein
MARFISKKSMQGFTLIELMVSLVLSLVSVIALMSVYKTTAKSAAEASFAANIDGQIALGLLASDRILQSAGYNVSSGSSSYGGYIKIYDGGTAIALVGGVATGSAVVWKSSSTKCQALVGGYSLKYYGEPGYDCTGVELPSGTVPNQTLINIPTAAIPNSVSPGLTRITIKSTPINSYCQPFGISSAVPGGAYTAAIDANIYAGSSSTLANTVTSSTCLFNFR